MNESKCHWNFNHCLAEEGMYNEIVSFIQNLRKKTKFKVIDDIELYFFINKEEELFISIYLKDEDGLILKSATDMCDLKDSWEDIEKDHTSRLKNRKNWQGKSMSIIYGLGYILNKTNVKKIELLAEIPLKKVIVTK